MERRLDNGEGLREAESAPTGRRVPFRERRVRQDGNPYTDPQYAPERRPLVATTPNVPLSPEVLRERATLTVPEAGRLLGLGRRSSYLACERGDIPCITIGGRKVVPSAKLAAMLGIELPR